MCKHTHKTKQKPYGVYYLLANYSEHETHDKSPREIRDTTDIPQHNKGSLQQARSKHQLKWRETQAIPPKSGTSQGCPLPPYLYINIILQVLAGAINQLMRTQGIQSRKEEVKVSLCIDDMIV